MSGVFISYRQDDAKPWALLLRDSLVEAFGDEHVFLDKDALHAGNWHQQIVAALDRSRVVLVVMGRRWLTSPDESGQPRLMNPNDVHRQEIALALSHPDVTVIPVRVDNATIPRAEDLPSDIRALVDQQSRELSDMSLRRNVDLGLLIEDIERATGLARKQNSESSFGQHLSRRALSGIVAILGLGVLGAGWLVWQTRHAEAPGSGVQIGLRQPDAPAPVKPTPPAPGAPAPASVPTVVEVRTTWGERQMAEDGIGADRQVSADRDSKTGSRGSRSSFRIWSGSGKVAPSRG